MRKSCLLIMTMVVLFSINIAAEKNEKGKVSFFKEMNDKSKVPAWNKDGKMFSQDKTGTKAKELTIEDFTPIELPYEQVHVYSEEYSIIIYDDWYDEYYEVTLHGVPLKFTLTEETIINITALNDLWGAVTFAFVFKNGISPDDYIGEIWPPEFIGDLSVGIYYLFIHDAEYYYVFEEYLECTIFINEIETIYYKELDYSTIVSEENPVSSILNRQTPFISLGEDYITARGLGFSAEVEAGKDYIFTFNFTTSIMYMEQVAVLAVLDGNLPYDDFEYNILAAGFCEGEETSEFMGGVYFSATKTETVKLLFMPMVCYSDIMLEISMKEAEPPISLFEMLDQTEKVIVYSENLLFIDAGRLGDETSFFVAGEDGLFRWSDGVFYAVPYKISLKERDFIEINYHQADDAYLYLYRKTITGYELIDRNDDWYDLDSYIFYTADEDGDYYIVGTTYGSMTMGKYIITVTNLNETQQNAITLFEMLDQTENIITYSENLSIIEVGALGNGNSFLVEGDDYLFKYFGYNYYAMSYKISLLEGNFIEIHHKLTGDAYLYIYKKTVTGYEWVASDDDSGDEGDSYIYFIAPEEGDYYIVNTTYGDMETGLFALAVWNTGEMPSLPYILLTDIYANKTSVTVPANASDIDILKQLMVLEITGITNYGNEIKINNNPFLWDIAFDNRSASYYPMDIEYYGEELVIQINFDSGIKNFEKTPSVLVYTNDKTIYIKNTTGGTNVNLFDITGRMIKSGKTINSLYTITVERQGIYIVRVGNEAYKVVVR